MCVVFLGATKALWFISLDGLGFFPRLGGEESKQRELQFNVARRLRYKKHYSVGRILILCTVFYVTIHSERKHRTRHNNLLSTWNVINTVVHGNSSKLNKKRTVRVKFYNIKKIIN